MSDKIIIDDILNEMDSTLGKVLDLIESTTLDQSDQYKKINYTYYKLFCTHCESLMILTANHHYFSGFVLARTMLELFVKSFYIEFVAKIANKNVDELIYGEKDFPNFFSMTKALEEYENNDYGNFKDSFNQFTKSYLATYEKLSLFAHCRGEIIKVYQENDNVAYTTEQVTDILLTAKGMLEQLSLLLFFTQNKAAEIGKLLEEFNIIEKSSS